MNINKIALLLLPLLQGLERKINIFLDYLFDQTCQLETVEGLIPTTFYFYNPPSSNSYYEESNRKEREKKERQLEALKRKKKGKEKYLECVKLRQEDCHRVLVNKIDRKFKQWLELQISLSYPNPDYAFDWAHIIKHPKPLDINEWQEKNLLSFRRNQIKVISSKEALIITQNWDKEWYIVHVKKQTLQSKPKLIVNISNHSMSNDDPHFMKVTKSRTSGYMIKVKNWSVTKDLEISL